MTQYPFINSFGVEIETEQIVRGHLSSNLRKFFSEEHDASIETPVKVNPDNPAMLFEDAENLLNFPRQTMGSEFVSRVFNSEDPESRKAIQQLCGWIISQGESWESFRSGIHVHVAMPYNLKVLKNMTLLAAHLEQVFYYYGGMGYKFRGVDNDFTYCRPFTQYGPSVVRGEDGFFQVFSKENLLEARTEEEFFDQYGGIDLNNPPSKYTPVRYGYITFYPLVTKGTIEFRVFNKTLNPNRIWSAMRLCQKFCEASMSSRLLLNLPENSIYSPHTKEHVLKTLKEFAGTYDLDELSTETAIQTISLTPEIKAEKTYVVTHLGMERIRVSYRFRNQNTLPSASPIKQPNFVDVHQLERGLRR